MRVLQITPDTEKMISDVIDHAERNKWSYAKLLALQAGEIPPAGDDPNYIVHIHDGYRVAYTIEQHKETWFKHMSISVDTKSSYPNEAAVSVILESFGMDPDYSKSLVYIEENVQAVNILQALNG